MFSFRHKNHTLVVTMAVAGAFILLGGYRVEAHAILVESTPAPNSVIVGPDVTIRLRFNVRVDGKRSRISIGRTDQSLLLLSISDQRLPDVLVASAQGLPPGTYHIRWQVLASDGHISTGEVPLSVRVP